MKYKERGIKIASKIVFDVYKGIPNILMYDYHNKIEKSESDILSLCKKYNVTVIFDNINTKEDIEYAKSNSLDYVYGQYYKKIKRIKNIIDDLSK